MQLAKKCFSELTWAGWSSRFSRKPEGHKCLFVGLHVSFFFFHDIDSTVVKYLKRTKKNEVLTYFPQIKQPISIFNLTSKMKEKKISLVFARVGYRIYLWKKSILLVWPEVRPLISMAIHQRQLNKNKKKTITKIYSRGTQNTIFVSDLELPLSPIF